MIATILLFFVWLVALFCEKDNFRTQLVEVTAGSDSRELVQGWIVFHGTPVPVTKQNMTSHPCRSFLFDVVWDEVFAVIADFILRNKTLGGAKTEMSCWDPGATASAVLIVTSLESWISENLWQCLESRRIGGGLHLDRLLRPRRWRGVVSVGWHGLRTICSTSQG